MHRYFTTVLVLLLSGCGVEVASTAAVSGVGRAQEAQQAVQTTQQFQQKLDASMQAVQQSRDNAEKAAGQ